MDYINRTLSIESQLGKRLSRNAEEAAECTTTKSELHLKTKNDKINPFYDDDYICCSTYGKPRSKDFHFAHYKKLLQKLGLPDIRWHDLRSTYCTLFLKSDFNPKAVSKLMGHDKEIITMDVYGDNKNL